MSTKDLIFWLLGQQWMTLNEIAKHAGIKETTVPYHIARLKRDKQIHIGGWVRGRNGPVALWAAGPGEDAPKPPRLTKEQYSARYREKNRTLLVMKKRQLRGTNRMFRPL